MTSYKITVPANVEWYDTGITIKDRSYLFLKATGSVSPYSGGSSFFGPEGQAGNTSQSSGYTFVHPTRTLNFCKLVGRIKTGADYMYLDIGSSHAEYIPLGGRLELAINDIVGTFGDNRGSFNVRVTVSSNLHLLPPSEQDGVDPSCPCHNVNGQPAKGNPISMRTAEKYEEVTDLSVPSPAEALTFTRNYRQSQLNSSWQPMGAGWQHNHTLSIDVPVSTNDLIAHLEKGTLVKFAYMSSTLYKAKAGANAQVDVNPGSTTARYTLTTTDRSTFIFDSTGKLTKRQWLKGQTVEEWTYTYFSTAPYTGLLQEVNDGYGRKLQFTYINNPGQYDHLLLLRVGDHTVSNIDSPTLTDRYVKFVYVQKLNSSFTPISQALLSTVRDVRDQTWTYKYYGQQTGENTPTKVNLLTQYLSPIIIDTVTSITLDNLSYTLNGSNAITQIVQDLGKIGTGTALKSTTYDFDAVANVTYETTAAKTVTHVFAGGVYAGEINAAGEGTLQSLLPNYRPETFEDANGHATSMNWDTDGKRLNSVTNALNQTTAFTYDSQDRLTQSSDSEGRPTFYVYDSVRRQPSLILTAPYASDLAAVSGDMESLASWAAVGTATRVLSSGVEPVDSGTYSLKVTATGANAGVTSSWSQTAGKIYLVIARVYPVSGQVKMQVGGINVTSSTAAADMNTWQTLRLAVKASSSASQTLQFLSVSASSTFYADSAHVIEMDGFSTAGQIRVQQYAYDQKGRTLQEATLSIDDRSTTPAGTLILGKVQETTRTYNTTGSGNGLLWTVQQDDIGGTNDISTTYTYDAVGRVKKVQNTSNFGSCETSFTLYDNAGNVLASVCNYDPGASPEPTTVAGLLALFNVSTPEKNNVTTYEYDAMGRRIKTTVNAGASWNQSSLTVYDALSRVVRTIQNYVAQGTSLPQNWVFESGVWKQGSGSTVISFGADNNQNIISDMKYNAWGLVRWQRNVLGNVTLFGYDDANRLVKTVQNAANDSYNNDFGGDPLLSAYTPNSADDQDIVTSQTYDAVGNVTSSTDARGMTSFTVYDALNRPVKTIQNAKAAATIDLDPNTAVLVGSVVTYPYNAANDPRSDDYVASTAPDRDQISLTEYDAMGRVVCTRRLMENRGLLEQWDVTLYGYDTLGRQVRTIQHASQPEYNISTDADLTLYKTSFLSSAPDQDIWSETQYDTQGRVQDTIDVNNRKMRQIYDGLNRVRRTISNYVPQGTSLPENWVFESGVWKQAAAGTAIDFGTGFDQNRITDTFYDTDGRVASSLDAAGRVSASGYDAYGRTIISVQNFVDKVPVYQPFNQWGWQTSAWYDQTSGGAAIQRGTGYDQNLISGTTYDNRGRVLYTRDALGKMTYFVYDSVGRQIRTIQNYVPQGASLPENWVFESGTWKQSAGGTAIDFGTANDQNLISETTYDVAGRVVSTSNVNGRVMLTLYDRLGRQIRTIQNYSVQGSSLPQKWVFEGGVWKQSTGGTAINHGANDQNLISETRYNKAGQTLSSRDAHYTQTQMQYDAAGRNLQMTAAQGTAIETASYTNYDKAGRVLRRIASYVYPGVSPDDWQSDPNDPWLFGGTTETTLNGQNRITTSTYDRANRVIQTTDPADNTTRTIYRKDGQVDQSLDASGIITLYRYDALGRRVRVVQNYVPQGTSDPINWVYDTTAWKQVIGGTLIDQGTKNDRNIIVVVAYNANGQVSSLRNPRGALTTYAYDALGRRTSLTNPLSKTWLTAFTESGGATSTTQTMPGLTTGGTYTVTRVFDRVGRLTSLEYGAPSNTPDVKFSYSPAGDRVQMTEYSVAGFNMPVRQTKYTYDAAHRLTAVAFDNDGNLSTDETVSYTYDRLGRRLSVSADTATVDFAANYEYDAQGRITKITDWANQKTKFTYDAAGRPILETRYASSGELSTDVLLTTEYQYDGASRLTRLTHNRSADMALEFLYTLDARGHRTSVQEQAEPTTTYLYNDAGITTNGGAWTNAAPYKKTTLWSDWLSLSFTGKRAVLTYGTGPDHSRFDIYINGTLSDSVDAYAPTAGEAIFNIILPVSRVHVLEMRNRSDKMRKSRGTVMRFKKLAVFDAAVTPQIIRYEYDALSRLTRAAHDDASRLYNYLFDVAGNRTQEQVTIGITTTTTNWTYNAANQMLTQQIGANPVLNFTHDANGNMTNDGTNAYTWDRANRLLSMGGSSYTYDGSGNRRSQTIGGVATQYLLDTQPGLALVLAETTPTVTTRYVQGPMGPAFIQENTRWVMPLRDGLGSVRRELLLSGSPQASKTYDPFGQPYNETGTWTGPLAFTGEQRDANGLQYHRARYYRPGFGAWTAQDILEQDNRYAYVQGNAINLVDKNGMQSTINSFDPGQGEDSAIAAGIAAGGAAGGLGAILYVLLNQYNMYQLRNSNVRAQEERARQQQITREANEANREAMRNESLQTRSEIAQNPTMPPIFPGFNPKDIEAFGHLCGYAFLAILSTLIGQRVGSIEKIGTQKNCNPAETLAWKQGLLKKSIRNDMRSPNIDYRNRYLYQYSITGDEDEYHASLFPPYDPVFGINADGINEATCSFIETKFIKDRQISPYVEANWLTYFLTRPPFLLTNVLLDLRWEIFRYTMLILNPYIPIVGLDLYTNEPAAVPFFQAELAATPNSRVILR